MLDSLSFETWSSRLRADCIARDRLEAFDGLGEYVLTILYEKSLDPTVEAIVQNGIGS